MLHALTIFSLASFGPAILITHGVICGIMKDGSPFRKDWWL